jgi:hypothetical protein
VSVTEVWRGGGAGGVGEGTGEAGEAAGQGGPAQARKDRTRGARLVHYALGSH